MCALMLSMMMVVWLVCGVAQSDISVLASNVLVVAYTLLLCVYCHETPLFRCAQLQPYVLCGQACQFPFLFSENLQFSVLCVPGLDFLSKLKMKHCK